MKIEEKIARAYHKDLSWRKVLVRLEPDAHNNMVVRRMFANAYGWPVVKHLCDTHFGYTAAARTRDADEKNVDSANEAGAEVGVEGEQVSGQLDLPKEELHPDKSSKIAESRSTEDLHKLEGADTVAEINKDLHNLKSKPINRETRTNSEIRESRDEVSDLVSRINVAGRQGDSYSSLNSGKNSLQRVARNDSGRWSDRIFEGSDDDSDDEQLLIELEEAKARGAALTEEEKRLLSRLSSSSKLSKRSKKSVRSNQSGESGKTPPRRILREESGDVVTEPTEMEAEQKHELEEALKPDEQMLSLTGIGLQKPVDEQVSPESPKARDRKGSLGVAEQVAFAQRKKDDVAS